MSLITRDTESGYESRGSDGVPESSIEVVHQKPLGGAPRGNKNAEKSGHYRRKAQLQAVSFDDLHGNSAGAIQIRERYSELLAHCGPRVNAITQRLIQRTCFTEYLLDHLDFYIVTQGAAVINKRKRSVIPVVAERSRVLQSLLTLYDKLGYEQPDVAPCFECGQPAFDGVCVRCGFNVFQCNCKRQQPTERVSDQKSSQSTSRRAKSRPRATSQGNSTSQSEPETQKSTPAGAKDRSEGTTSPAVPKANNSMREESQGQKQESRAATPQQPNAHKDADFGALVPNIWE